MKIEPGKYFEIAYKLYRIDEEGNEELVHEVTPDDPDRVIDGVTIGLVEALDKELAGKEAGYKFNLTAMPEEAFGPYTQDEIYRIPRERMTVDGKFDEEMFAPGEVIPCARPTASVSTASCSSSLPPMWLSTSTTPWRRTKYASRAKYS